MSMQADPWVQTWSGRAFDLLDPQPDMIHPADIAHALSRIARFAGHTVGEHGYSVAQHSLLVAEIVRTRHSVAYVRAALLHDAGEAYYGDVTSPVQRAMARLGSSAGWDELRRRVDAAIAERFGLGHEPIGVKRADLEALFVERRAVMASSDRDWQLPYALPEDVTVRLARSHCLDMPAYEARTRFAEALAAAGVR